MIGSEKLTNVIRMLLDDTPFPNEIFSQIIKRYSPDCKCSKTIKTLNYAELCKLNEEGIYYISIIQNEKMYDADMQNHFFGAYEQINACYQINPFKAAIIIARNTHKSNTFRIFFYEPYAFDETIILPNVSCFKYLFEYFNVYKSNGDLAKDLCNLQGEKEIIAISKQTLWYNAYEEKHQIRIILRWYEGYLS